MATAGPSTSSASPAVFSGTRTNQHLLTLEVWETSLNSTTNTSTVNVRLKENCGTNNYSQETCTGSITIDGTTYAITTKQYSNATKNATITVSTKTKSVNHTGKTSISVSAVMQFSDQSVAYKITTGTSVSGTYVLADTGYVSTPAPTAPTYLSASTNDSAGINLSWGGAGGSITNYGIFYNTYAAGWPTSGSSPDFTTVNTTYTDTGAGSGGTRYYWVRAQGPGGNSAWYPNSTSGVTGTQIVPITYYDVSFTNSFGSNGTPATQSIAAGSSGTFPNPGSRSGYTFTGWNNNSNYTPGSSTPAINSATSYTADTGWVALAPGFTDETVTSQLFINQTIESTANSSVSASNTTSYSLQSAGSGLSPLSWLSINTSTGALSGSTNVVGQYTFRVAATGTSTTAYSNTITINVVYPGKRINSSFSQAAMTTAKRWDASSGWTPLIFMKRFIGVGQPGADANGWTNITN